MCEAIPHAIPLFSQDPKIDLSIEFIQEIFKASNLKLTD